MKILTKVIGLFLIVFSFAYYQASPIQRHHHHIRNIIITDRTDLITEQFIAITDL
ncbi:hypothetical protein [Chryseobacterium wanjuense]